MDNNSGRPNNIQHTVIYHLSITSIPHFQKPHLQQENDATCDVPPLHLHYQHTQPPLTPKTMLYQTWFQTSMRMRLANQQRRVEALVPGGAIRRKGKVKAWRWVCWSDSWWVFELLFLDIYYVCIFIFGGLLLLFFIFHCSLPVSIYRTNYFLVAFLIAFLLLNDSSLHFV